LSEYRFFKNFCFYFFLIFSFHGKLSGQNSNYQSSEILLALQKLNTLTSVLYIAAHPDDENTAVLAYMSKGKLARTAYLSLTRGDGGQNLLGNEKGDLLGLIRTEELLSARRIDGAEQFFSRAVDFGYSKTTSETLRFWDKDTILGDVVKVIRKFRPDIIITRFSETQGGHGHHLASAILAKEAFFASADPKRYAEQLDELEIWQPKRLYWNTWRPSDEALEIDIGEYNPILGKSYNELSANSRSMHKSQGFGVSPSRGSQKVYFDYMTGEKAGNDLFEGLDCTWSRVRGGDIIESKLNKIIESFSPSNPEKIVPSLLNLLGDLESVDDDYWRELKINELKSIIKMCTGLWMESIVWDPDISPGENIDVRAMILNRSGIPITLENVSTKYSTTIFDQETNLKFNEPKNIKQNIVIPSDAEFSQPYWLRKKQNSGMFRILDNEIGNPKNDPDIYTDFKVNISGNSFVFTVPTTYRWNDAVKGEMKRPFFILPKLSLSVDQNIFVSPNGKSHEVNVTISAKTDSVKGKLFIDLPVGWVSDINSHDFSIAKKGSQKSFVFVITPGESARSGSARIMADVSGKEYDQEIIEIDYPHIEYQTVLRSVTLDLVKLDINIESRKIGYIMGSGDNIPQSLRQIGFEVDLLTDEYLDFGDLSNYEVIICGIRAFNTREELSRQQTRLIDFVERGGTWVVQHNTRFGFQTEQIGPYPFTATGRDRISEEDAELNILVPEHQIFNYPNKITEADFEGWVQERGLYFAENWEGKLYPLLSGNDTGEPAKLGGLLFSEYGKGAFIFTAYSWFRQLPAGVTGAYRLFVNIISAKGKNGGK
jgi:LmbE family N-acetylglucosaminyl deacetylase